MTNTRKSVRYYIDRDADTPVVRSVPVVRTQEATPRPSIEAIQQRNGNLATLHAAEESRRRSARSRLNSLVRATVRRHDQQHES